jgi:hypothetical protein
MDAYCKEIIKLEGKFYGIEYTHVVWDKNQAANELSKLGSSRAKVPHGVFVRNIVKPSIKEEEDQVVEKPLDQPLLATVPLRALRNPLRQPLRYLRPLSLAIGECLLSSFCRRDPLC